MKNRIAALTMAALLLLYLVLVMRYAVVLISTDDATARAMGIALAVLPLLGAWALYSELSFVLRGERLVKTLASLGELPVDDLPRLPSGRIDPKEADKQFPAFQAEVEAAPADWKAWTRLGLAYDASGDRKRARWATRQAIRLERGKPLSERSA